MTAVCLALAGCGHAVPRIDQRPLRPLVVVVRAEGDAAPTARAVADELSARLTRLDMQVIPRQAIVERDPAPDLAAVEELYYALNTERAEAGARDFLRSLDAGEYGRFDEALLVRALMLLAETALSAGDDATCDESIARLLAIRTDLVLDAATYSPVLRARVDSRRSQAVPSNAGIAFLDVPADARVWVDGSEIERRAARASVGRHVVRIETPGYAPQTTLVDVADDSAQVVFDAQRSPASIDAIAGAPGDGLSTEASQILASLGWSARVLDARPHGDRVEYRWGWANDRAVVRELDRSSPPTEVAEALLLAERDEAREHASAERRHRRVRRASWVLGSVAVSAGAATAVGMLRPITPTGWTANGTIEGSP